MFVFYQSLSGCQKCWRLNCFYVNVLILREFCFEFSNKLYHFKVIDWNNDKCHCYYIMYSLCLAPIFKCLFYLHYFIVNKPLRICSQYKSLYLPLAPFIFFWCVNVISNITLKTLQSFCIILHWQLVFGN